MSDKIKVNTELVAFVAADLRTKNERIDRAFDKFRKKAENLENKWNSAAGSVAGTLMYQIFNGNESRSAIIDNYITILEKQVITGYEYVEGDINVKLADEFK